jgi:hypothetical protein
MDSEKRKLLVTIEVWTEKTTTFFPGTFTGARVITLKKGTERQIIVPLGSIQRGLCAILNGKNEALFEQEL